MLVAQLTVIALDLLGAALHGAPVPSAEAAAVRGLVHAPARAEAAAVQPAEGVVALEVVVVAARPGGQVEALVAALVDAAPVVGAVLAPVDARVPLVQAAGQRARVVGAEAPVGDYRRRTRRVSRSAGGRGV
jgi:hypothetical protein